MACFTRYFVLSLVKEFLSDINYRCVHPNSSVVDQSVHGWKRFHQLLGGAPLGDVLGVRLDGRAFLCKGVQVRLGA